MWDDYGKFDLFNLLIVILIHDHYGTEQMDSVCMHVCTVKVDVVKVDPWEWGSSSSHT